MPLQSRARAAYERLVTTASRDGSRPFTADAVGVPVECLLASREALVARHGVDAQWATTAVYVLIGGREMSLGAESSVKEFDEALKRSQSEDPPDDPDATESFDQHQHTDQWRARFYTGLTRDALRRIDQHSAKPWWNRALLCRQSAPWPYDIADIGYLEGMLHDLLDAAYWLKREGRASHEHAIKQDRARDLRKAHLPTVTAAIRMLGVPLDTAAQVTRLTNAGSEETPDA